eukprot:TRINITY_DN826_c0_g1_i1.p1 TRINITY_DN826_c0_g1~~TRINITY_DN826_c0_g1_i1.p1  ORF type:complete len:227 (+),score=50.25 TRINITY_DN826_c0_g1_i1:250-930(+)
MKVLNEKGEFPFRSMKAYRRSDFTSKYKASLMKGICVMDDAILIFAKFGHDGKYWNNKYDKVSQKWLIEGETPHTESSPGNDEIIHSNQTNKKIGLFKFIDHACWVFCGEVKYTSHTVSPSVLLFTLTPVIHDTPPPSPSPPLSPPLIPDAYSRAVEVWSKIKPQEPRANVDRIPPPSHTISPPLKRKSKLPTTTLPLSHIPPISLTKRKYEQTIDISRIKIPKCK